MPVLLKRFDAKKVELIASGALVRVLDGTYLLTAAHVTDRRTEKTLLIPGRSGFIPANGWVSSIRMPVSGRRLDDKLDVAYVRLDSNCVNDLHPDCTVLEGKDVSLEGDPALRIDYTFAGYPWRKTRVRGPAVETDFTTFTGGEATEREYTELGLRRCTHIVIRFRRKQAFSQRLGRVTASPLPDGMSGGGVYAWSAEALKRWPVRLPLIGIATESVPDRSLLVATRLHVYLGCIFHNEPDLAVLAKKRLAF